MIENWVHRKKEPKVSSIKIQDSQLAADAKEFDDKLIAFVCDICNQPNCDSYSCHKEKQNYERERELIERRVI